MEHILFPIDPLTYEPYANSQLGAVAAKQQLRGILLALQLSGFPAPDAPGQFLLARYVARQVPLAAVLPYLTLNRG